MEHAQARPASIPPRFEAFDSWKINRDLRSIINCRIWGAGITSSLLTPSPLSPSLMQSQELLGESFGPSFAGPDGKRVPASLSSVY
jgi:hypothetical protein